MRVVSMRSAGDFIEFMAVGAEGEPDAEIPRLYRLNLFGNRKAIFRWGTPFGDVYLDCRTEQAGVNTTVTLDDNYPEHNGSGELVVVQGSSCPSPGTVVEYTRLGQELTLDTDMLGGRVFYGYPFTSLITLPDIDSRDASGIIQTRASTRITDFDVTLTGHVDALVTLDHGTNYPAQEWRGSPSGLDFVGYGRESWRVQFKQDSNNGTLTLSTDSHVGCDIHQVEWRGTYHKTGRRF